MEQPRRLTIEEYNAEFRKNLGLIENRPSVDCPSWSEEDIERFTARFKEWARQRPRKPE